MDKYENTRLGVMFALEEQWGAYEQENWKDVMSISDHVKQEAEILLNMKKDELQ